MTGPEIVVYGFGSAVAAAVTGWAWWVRLAAWDRRLRARHAARRYATFTPDRAPVPDAALEPLPASALAADVVALRARLAGGRKETSR